MLKNTSEKSEIKILQLSDSHISSSNVKELGKVLNALWKDLENFKDIDFILFTGDLVKMGDKRDDFEKAFRVFIEPLLMKTGVNKDRFFLVPGNHDIQKSAIDEIIEDGLRVRMTNRDALNLFLDRQIETGFNHIERLENFTNFKNSKVGEGYTVTSNKLFTTHVIERNNVKTGIACLNSAWRATGIGNGYDHGKMLIGERQVDACLTDIEDCDIKIALHHHPLDWLMEYDQIDMELIIFKEFDFIFCGHLHHANLKMIQNFEDKIVVIQGGSLYKGRSHYNGYSILSINPQKGKGILHLRTYFDDRKKFDKAIDRCDNGKVVINLKRGKMNIPLLSEGKRSITKSF